MTTQVEWGDGSGDKIYLTYSASEETQIVSVSSDTNTGYLTRTKDIDFKVVAGGTTITRTLTIQQTGKDITIITRNNTAISSNNVAVGYE